MQFFDNDTLDFNDMMIEKLQNTKGTMFSLKGAFKQLLRTNQDQMFLEDITKELLNGPLP